MGKYYDVVVLGVVFSLRVVGCGEVGRPFGGMGVVVWGEESIVW